MKLLTLLAFASLPMALSSVAQEPPQQLTATVVVFTPGGHWHGFGSQLKKPLWGRADMVSIGNFYDGKERIAWLSHSRYLKLQLPSGVHSFSADLSTKHPNEKEQVTLTLEPGATYFLALTATTNTYAVVNTFASHLQSSTCELFVEANEAHVLEPVREKDIRKELRGTVKPMTFSPECAAPKPLP